MGDAIPSALPPSLTKKDYEVQLSAGMDLTSICVSDTHVSPPPLAQGLLAWNDALPFPVIPVNPEDPLPTLGGGDMQFLKSLEPELVTMRSQRKAITKEK